MSKTEKINLLEAKLSVLAAEFQEVINTREVELKNVKTSWRKSEDVIAEKASEIALLTKKITALQEENVSLQSQLADTHANLEKLQKTQKNVAMAQFVRGQL